MTIAPIRLPVAWLAEAKEAYEQYRIEWESEDMDAKLHTGLGIGDIQPWPEFFSEYLYAELAACVLTGDAKDNE